MVHYGSVLIQFAITVWTGIKVGHYGSATIIVSLIRPDTLSYRTRFRYYYSSSRFDTIVCHYGSDTIIVCHYGSYTIIVLATTVLG
jgi:hypothetical protein